MNWKQIARNNLACLPVYTAIPVIGYLFIKSQIKSTVLTSDGMIYNYGGYLLTIGKLPYVDMFSLSPPGIYYLTALTRFITDDPSTHVFVTSLLTGVVVIVLIYLSQRVSFLFTDSKVSAAISGYTLITYIPFLYFWVRGPYTKYFAGLSILATLLIIELEYKRFILPSIIVAPLFWQFTGPIVIVVGVMLLLGFSRGYINSRELIINILYQSA